MTTQEARIYELERTLEKVLDLFEQAPSKDKFLINAIFKELDGAGFSYSDSTYEAPVYLPSDTTEILDEAELVLNGEGPENFYAEED